MDWDILCSEIVFYKEVDVQGSLGYFGKNPSKRSDFLKFNFF